MGKIDHSVRIACLLPSPPPSESEPTVKHLQQQQLSLQQNKTISHVSSHGNAIGKTSYNPHHPAELPELVVSWQAVVPPPLYVPGDEVHAHPSTLAVGEEPVEEVASDEHVESLRGLTEEPRQDLLHPGRVNGGVEKVVLKAEGASGAPGGRGEQLEQALFEKNETFKKGKQLGISFASFKNTIQFIFV